ncbi:peptidase M4 [Sporolactobacillus kofuensis]|uniref:Peptidase M4 n=1 Tax=Sporolactobacillus kofuensis TaxID=269672 RepID=A0ABW1WHG7_9BACL
MFITVIVLIVIGSWSLYTNNTNFQNQSAQSAIKKAKKWYSFNQVLSVTAYHGSDDYQVIKAKQGRKTMYFWIPDRLKKAPYFERAANKGLTKEQALQKLSGKGLDVQKIISVRLGAIQGNPVWEITFLNSKHKYNYVSISFDNGKEAQRILNV